MHRARVKLAQPSLHISPNVRDVVCQVSYYRLFPRHQQRIEALRVVAKGEATETFQNAAPIVIRDVFGFLFSKVLWKVESVMVKTGQMFEGDLGVLI